MDQGESCGLDSHNLNLRFLENIPNNRNVISTYQNVNDRSHLIENNDNNKHFISVTPNAHVFNDVWDNYNIRQTNNCNKSEDNHKKLREVVNYETTPDVSLNIFNNSTPVNKTHVQAEYDMLQDTKSTQDTFETSNNDYVIEHVQPTLKEQDDYVNDNEQPIKDNRVRDIPELQHGPVTDDAENNCHNHSHQVNEIVIPTSNPPVNTLHESRIPDVNEPTSSTILTDVASLHSTLNDDMENNIDVSTRLLYLYFLQLSCLYSFMQTLHITNI